MLTTKSISRQLDRQLDANSLKALSSVRKLDSGGIVFAREFKPGFQGLRLPCFSLLPTLIYQESRTNSAFQATVCVEKRHFCLENKIWK